MYVYPLWCFILSTSLISSAEVSLSPVKVLNLKFTTARDEYEMEATWDPLAVTSNASIESLRKSSNNFQFLRLMLPDESSKNATSTTALHASPANGKDIKIKLCWKERWMRCLQWNIGNISMTYLLECANQVNVTKRLAESVFQWAHVYTIPNSFSCRHEKQSAIVWTPIRYVTPRRSFAALQKSRLNHRSYVWTEALSGIRLSCGRKSYQV